MEQERDTTTTATEHRYSFEIAIAGVPPIRGRFTFEADSAEHALELLEKVTGNANATITILSGPHPAKAEEQKADD